MKNTLGLLLTAFAVMSALSGDAIAQVTPSADAYTNSTAATTNFGGATTLGVANSANSIQSSFLQFDLSSIPSGYTGSNIAKASLKLYVNSVTIAGSFNVDYINGPWSEKTITANLSPALGTTVVSGVSLTAALAHDFILIDVTPAVQAWLNKSQPNDGLALVANSPMVATFDSKENTGQSHAAELDIVFAGSGTGTITGVTAGSGLVGGGTSGKVTLSLLNTCASGQILQWNGTAWACANATSGGTITGVAAGTDLTGGGTTGNITLNLNTAALQTSNDARYAQLNVNNTFTKTMTFASGQTFPGAGSVSSVGLAALSSDFTVSGSPITGSGTLSLGWAVAPTSANTANSIVKRDSAGNFSASGLSTVSLAASVVSAVTPLGGGNGPAVQASSVASSGVGVSGTGGLVGVYGSTIGSGGSANGVQGSSTNATAVRGDDAGGGAGVVGTSSTGYGVSGSSSYVGVYGHTTGSGGSANGVQGASTNATAVRGDDAGSGSGVVGTSASGFGIFGTSANGYGFATDSNVQQARSMGGWVKFMAYVDPFAPGGIAVTRCFNSQQTGAAISTPPCGITISHVSQGINILDFGFQVNDRFVLVSGINNGGFPTTNFPACPISGPCTVNQLEMITINVFTGGNADNGFFVFIY